jgi:hypothetical protein
MDAEVEALLQQAKDQMDLRRRTDASLETRLAALRRNSPDVTPPPKHAVTKGSGVPTTTTDATLTLPEYSSRWMCCGRRWEESEDEDEEAAADRYVRQVQEQVRLEAMLPAVPNLRTSAADAPSTAGHQTSTSDDGGGAVVATFSDGEGSQPRPLTEPPARRRRNTSNNSEALLSGAVELIDDYFAYAESTDVRQIAEIKLVKAKAKKRPPGSGLPPSYHAAVCSDSY